VHALLARGHVRSATRDLNGLATEAQRHREQDKKGKRKTEQTRGKES
jgi:hypothetical protein